MLHSQESQIEIVRLPTHILLLDSQEQSHVQHDEFNVNTEYVASRDSGGHIQLSRRL